MSIPSFSISKITILSTAILLTNGTLHAQWPSTAPSPQHLTYQTDTPVSASDNSEKLTQLTEPEITILHLQEIALQSNPTLQKLRNKITAAKGERIQSGLYPNPTISYEGEEIGDDNTAGKQGFAIEQEFLTAQKRLRNLQVADQELCATIQELNIQEIKVLNDVKIRAYELLSARRMSALKLQLLHISQESLNAAETLYQAKEVSKIDLLQTRISFNEANLALKKAAIDEKAAWERLVAMLGNVGIPLHKVTDNLESIPTEIDWETVWSRLQNESPEIALANVRLKQSQAVLCQEYANSKPNITVGAGAAYDYSGKQTVASVGVSIPLQIFDRNQGNIMKAQAEVAVANGEISRQVAVLREKWADTFKRHQNAAQEVKLYKETILPDANEAWKMSLTGYKQGEYGYLDLLSTQQTFLEMQTRYLESLLELARATALVEGMLLEGGLE